VAEQRAGLVDAALAQQTANACAADDKIFVADGIDFSALNP
jgi:hypothetical protein